MTMKVERCTNAAQWDQLVEGSGQSSSFLHSWAWGDAQQEYGRDVLRLGVWSEDTLIAVALLVVMELGFGRTYVFSPRGPVMAHDSIVSVDDVYDALILSDAFRSFMTEHHSLFWRFEPLQSVVVSGARRVEDIEPAETLLLDLSVPMDQLRSELKQKTRYNIGLAERKEVTVDFVEGTELVEPHWCDLWMKLLRETSERHGIGHHPHAYYATLFSTLGPLGVCELAVARYDGEVVAMAMMVRYGNTYTYVHGAATHEHKEVMAPQVLQWRAIQRAHAAGYRWYDFFGVSPVGASQHKLAGVSRFKRGFGGVDQSFPGTLELPMQRFWYTVYRLLKQLRSLAS